MTLYFCCDVDNLTTVMPMFRLIFSLVIRSLLHEEKHKYKLWLFLDEFSQLKKFDIIQEQITYVRSFGIRIMAFIQSTAQLKDLYGHDGADALLDNFQIKLYLKATNTDTGMYFEKLLGRKTVLQKKTSLSSNRRGVGVDGWTESTSEVGRSLLTADEILHLPNYEELIFHPSIYPYRGKKVQYYSDSRFKKLMNKPVKMPKRKMDAPLLPEFTSDLKISPDLEKLVEEKATSIKDPDISVATDDTAQEKIIIEILNSLVAAAEDTEVEELDVEAPDVDVSSEEIDAQEDLGKKADEEDEDEFI